MTTNQKVQQRNDTFMLTEFIDEQTVAGLLLEKGFNLEYTRWVYSWTPPAWMGKEGRDQLASELEKSDYRNYLITVREDLPV